MNRRQVLSRARSITRLKIHRLLILLIALPCFGQTVGVRLDNVAYKQVGSNIKAIGNPSITVCTEGSTPADCDLNKVTTYTDGTLVTPCPSDAQVTLTQTTVCVATGDIYGNYGFWIAPGTYSYMIAASGVTTKMYTFTASPGNGGWLLPSTVLGPKFGYTEAYFQYLGGKTIVCYDGTITNINCSLELGSMVLFGAPGFDTMGLIQGDSVTNTLNLYRFSDSSPTGFAWGLYPNSSIVSEDTTCPGVCLAWLDNTGGAGFSSLLVTPSTPASSSAACAAGQIWSDASYVYVCTATNTIKRAALSSF